MLKFDEEPPVRPGQVAKTASESLRLPVVLRPWPYLTMHEAAKDYAFFVPGLLCRWSDSLFKDPYILWRDCQSHEGHDLGLRELRTKNQCIDFCSNVRHADNWANTIWAVNVKRWDSLKKFICAVSVAEDAEAGVMHSVGVQPLECDDFTCLPQSKPVTVWFFGIYSHPRAAPGTPTGSLPGGGVALHAVYDKLSGQIMVTRSNTVRSPL